MKLLQNLKIAINCLQQWPGCWAICGGVAACIYRKTPRYTGDIDIAIIDHAALPAVKIAQCVVSHLGNKPLAGWVTDQHGVLIKDQALVIGRESGDGSYVGIDFLLPVLPWIRESVTRAQKNDLDYGFARVPTITPEDLIIAKMYAYQGNPDRSTDLDDILSLARDGITLDRAYLADRIRSYSLLPAKNVLNALKLG